MKLQTQIPVSKVDNPIDYNGQMLLMGSCFSENIGRKLEYFQFKSDQNPFGIAFHPKAIESMVERALEGEPYSEADIFYVNERWQSFDTHSGLSNASKENLLINLNASLQRLRLRLEKSTHIILTPGTAWVYRHLNSGQIVANCHKVPQHEFSKELLPIKTIIKSLERTIELIQSVNKEVQIIFTVSP
ncbi:MAG: GSCFA domain-containing protein, partial [Pricia sp.]|nr:GSCFA domain-containing protein [Pricia sp.]